MKNERNKNMCNNMKTYWYKTDCTHKLKLGATQSSLRKNIIRDEQGTPYTGYAKQIGCIPNERLEVHTRN